MPQGEWEGWASGAARPYFRRGKEAPGSGDPWPGKVLSSRSQAVGGDGPIWGQDGSSRADLGEPRGPIGGRVGMGFLGPMARLGRITLIMLTNGHKRVSVINTLGKPAVDPSQGYPYGRKSSLFPERFRRAGRRGSGYGQQVPVEDAGVAPRRPSGSERVPWPLGQDLLRRDLKI